MGVGVAVVGLFVLGLQRLVELAGEGGDAVHPGQDLGRDGAVEGHLHVDRAAGDGEAGVESGLLGGVPLAGLHGWRGVGWAACCAPGWMQTCKPSWWA